jgi:hypothetical protein
MIFIIRIQAQNWIIILVHLIHRLIQIFQYMRIKVILIIESSVKYNID